MESKRNIVKVLHDGNRSDFKKLFKENYELLVNFATSFLMSRSEAEDVVQNIFTHLWENSKGITFDQSLKAYLFKAVRNRCFNKLRNKNVRDRHNLLYLEALITSYSREEETDEVVERELKKAIGNLPPQVKSIVEQKYFHNKKIMEIADHLGVTKNTVKTQLQRGKAKLKKSLGINSSKLVLLLVCLSEWPS